jgi:ABC-2 type transport system ATP-binding protein
LFRRSPEARKKDAKDTKDQKDWASNHFFEFPVKIRKDPPNNAVLVPVPKRLVPPVELRMLFQLQDVTKTYGRVTALRNLSVEVPKGAVGLLGPNGSGKTTMIRTLLGLIRIDAGRGQVLGLDIRKQRLDIRQVVGLVPEDECLFPVVQGVEFVAYAGELAGMGHKDAMQRAHEVLDYVGLREERYRRVESYSTGMKQRIKIAAAIVHDPRLLILDEPTNGMDPAGREEILELARDLSRNKGMSLLFSSHLLPDVEAVCDYVVVLDRGRLKAHDYLAKLKEARQQLYEVRVKADQDQFARRLGEAGCVAEPHEDLLVVAVPAEQTQAVFWETAAASGHQIRYLRPRRNTLEEIFQKAVAEQD